MTTKFSDIVDQFLVERFINIFSNNDMKHKYMNQVWKILQDSYAYIGGIKGEEFVSPEAMLKVPFWKLSIKNGNVVMVRMYKDHNGRKTIAGGTDGSIEGKTAMMQTMKSDFQQGYSEVSGAAETFIQKRFPELYNKFRIPANQVSDIIHKKIELIDGDEYHYMRTIGGEKVEKILLGTLGKKFYGDALDL